MAIDGARGDGMVRFSGNVKPTTEPTSEPASTYNASTMLSESTVKPPLSSAPTTSKPLLQTTSSVEIPPPSSQPRLPPEIVKANGQLVGGYLPGLQPALVSETLMPGGGSVGGVIVPKQPPVGVVSEPVLPPGASEKLHESSPSGTTETVQIGNLTFSGVRVVNLSTPPTSGGSSGTTHETGTPPSTSITGSHTGSLGTGGTTSPKPNPPHEMPTPIPMPIGGSENLPAKLVSEPILPPGKEFTPPSGSTSSTSHEAETPPSAPVTGSHTGTHVGSPPSGGEKTPPHEMPTPIEVPPNQSQPVKVVSETVHTPPSEGSKTTTSQSRPTLPPVVGLPSSEHNATVITPVKRTSAPPHVTPPSEVARTPTNVITHLWIGWRIEPEVEEFIRRFVETFEHGRPPRMGGAPPPGASPSPPGVLPLPGAPLVVLLPQGAEHKQKVTV